MSEQDRIFLQMIHTTPIEELEERFRKIGMNAEFEELRKIIEE